MKTVADLLNTAGEFGNSTRTEQVVGLSHSAQPELYEVSWLINPKDVEIIDNMAWIKKRVIARSYDEATHNAGVRIGLVN